MIGVQEPKDGPSARLISNMLFNETREPPSPCITMFHMTFGQLVDHDIDRTPVSKMKNEETGKEVCFIIYGSIENIF